MIQGKSFELQTALEAAKIGARQALKYFDRDIATEMKEDNTPVTVADYESEQKVKEHILSKFPRAKFVGEETGGSTDEDEFWIIDPVDGTRSFSRGIPTWCVIVSLCRNKEIIVTVVFYPFGDTAYYAEKGKGAYVNGKRMHVSKITEMNKSYIGHGNLKYFKNKMTIINLVNASGSARNWEATYSSCLVAEGKLDVSVDGYGKVWDVAPFKLMVEEAGGKITRINGDEWDLVGRGAVITNGLLHEDVLKIVNSAS